MTGSISIKKSSGFVGAEISGIRLATISDDDFSVIQNALFTYGAIFFRDQHLTPEQHVAFAKRWGKVDISRFFSAVDGYPEIARVHTPPDQPIVVGGDWHTDQSFDPAPAMCSILSAQQLPAHGGDTLFASMGAAYDHLSDGLRHTLEGLSSWHSDSSFAKAETVLPGSFSVAELSGATLHPVIIRHPVTGRKAIYVNTYFTTHFEGWTEEESRPLLEYLYRYATQPSFCCRFTWSEGAVVIWDNRLVQHTAAADYLGEERLMHRVTVEGVALQS